MKDEFEEFFPCAVQKMNDTSEPANRPMNWKGKVVVEELPDAPLLANRKPPKYCRQQERPEHRAIIELAARGFDTKEISKAIGRCPDTVQDILRQPMLQQTLVNEVRRIHGTDEEVAELIKEEVLKSFQVYREIRDNPKARDADRIAAAEKFVERRYGKANQPINRGTDVDLNALSDADLAKMCPRQN